MAANTEHCGQVYQRNVPGIFLQYGNAKCIAVSSAVTFGLETINFSISTASTAKVEIEAVHQPPLGESLTNKALYEFSKKILTEKEVMAVTYETEKGIIADGHLLKSETRR